MVLNNFVNRQPNGNISNSITLSPLDSHRSNFILITSNTSLRESGPARIILNEVTSLTGPSQLHGPIAVVGQQADVIIANPAGIECDGCGFINTGIANLSAASPFLADGSVKFLTSHINGEINFSGTGLSKEANQSDNTTLIARKININAPVHANKRLCAKILGNKDSDSMDSLNLSAMGSMYADKIFIKGAVKNIDIHNKGEIKANSGLEITISGILDNSGVISSSEYADIDSENFKMKYNCAENCSSVYIANNMIN